MITLLLLSAGGLVAAPGLLRRLGRRLAPHEWARLSTAAFVVGTLLLELALTGVALPALLAALGWSGLADACARVMGHLAPRALAHLGWAAGALAAVAAVRAWRAARQLRHVRDAALADVPSQWRQGHSGYELVVVPSPEIVAFSVDAACPRIVVSEGLSRAVSPDELAVVLRHEEAHLRHRHGRYLAALRIGETAFGLLPFVRSSAAEVRLSLERWADESAADGNEFRRAALRAALLQVAYAATSAPLAAFGAVQTLLDRLAALDEPPPRSSFRRRTAVWIPVVGLGLLAALSFGGSAGDVHLALSHFCAA